MKTWGVDLGGTAIKVGLIEDGEFLAETEALTDVDGGPERVMDQIASLCQSLGQGASLGVGTPGTVDPLSGKVLYCNNLRWQNVDLAGGLRARLGVKVRAANDAALAALGENRFGATKGAACSAVVTLGTGIGVGVTLGGELWASPCGAPEFGHTTLHQGGRSCTCGRKGCFEMYCSSRGLALTAKEVAQSMGLELPLDGKSLFSLAAAGLPPARQVVDRWLDDLAEGVANVANAYRPQIIAFGGGLTKSGDWFLEPLATRARHRMYGADFCGTPDLKLCSLGYRAGMLGASLWAHED